MIANTIEALLADKGYEAVIPVKSNRPTPIPHDRTEYCWRNIVERLFNKLKKWRRIAAQYDKTKKSYLGFVSLVSTLQWIPIVHETYDTNVQVAGKNHNMASGLLSGTSHESQICRLGYPRCFTQISNRIKRHRHVKSLNCTAEQISNRRRRKT